jgi:hypothetical protein
MKVDELNKEETTSLHKATSVLLFLTVYKWRRHDHPNWCNTPTTFRGTTATERGSNTFVFMLPELKVL